MHVIEGSPLPFAMGTFWSVNSLMWKIKSFAKFVLNHSILTCVLSDGDLITIFDLFRFSHCLVELIHVKHEHHEGLPVNEHGLLMLDVEDSSV